jgi:chromosome segregation ATPase
MSDEETQTPESDGNNWEKAYKTAQANTQKTVEKKDAEIASLKEEKKALTESLKQSESELKKTNDSLAAKSAEFEQKLTGLQEELTGKQSELETALAQKQESDAVATRKSLILEFPGLASLEAEGLLPSDTDPEVLKEKLTKLSERMKTAADAEAVKSRQGAVPEGGAEDGSAQAGGETLESLYQQLVNEDPGSAKFQELEKRYDTMLEAKNNQT